MSTTLSRTRTLAAPLLVGLVGLLAAACAPTPPPYYGIYFNAPSVGYIGQNFTPTATATSQLPVSLTLDPTSTGCSFVDGVVYFEGLGTCVIDANQPGDATNAPSAQVQRQIGIHNCPPLISGRWTGPEGLSANVVASGSTFSGTIDLSSFGAGVQTFAGLVSCQIVSMTFNGVPLTGELSYDGLSLSSSYDGISIVLNAPTS